MRRGGIRRGVLRALAAAILIVRLLSGSRAEGSPPDSGRIFVDANHFLALDGREIALPDGCTEVTALVDGALYASGIQTGSGVRYALMDADGALLTRAVYSGMYYEGGMVLYRRSSLLGAMDPSGREVLAPVYTLLRATGDGRFLAAMTAPFDEQPDRIYRVVPDVEVTPLSIMSDDALGPLSCGRVRYHDADARKWGYLDADGNVAVAPTYQTATDFAGCCAKVSRNGRYGAIDPDGRELVPLRCDRLEIGPIAIAALRGRTVETFDPATGALLHTFPYEAEAFALVGNFVALHTCERLLLCRPDGDVVAVFDARAVCYPGCGGAVLCQSEADENGPLTLVLPDGSRASLNYWQLMPSADDGYIAADLQYRENYSETLHRMTALPRYDTVRYGLMNAQSETVLECVYDDVRPLGGGWFCARLEDEVRVVGASGQVLAFWRDTAGSE